VSATSQLAIGRARPTVLELPGRRIAALQAGSAEAPPVLLVPGYTGSKEDSGRSSTPSATPGST
jgi:hypothetical protein